MHNKTISWNDNWILIFICFVGRLLLEPSTSSSSSFMISYPNDNMDKRFFKNWVLHIPHCLRDLLWMVRAWSSISPIFFFSSYDSSWKKLLPSTLHSLHEWIPWSWEAIQSGYHHFCILHFFFYYFQVVLWFERPL